LKSLHRSARTHKSGRHNSGNDNLGLPDGGAFITAQLAGNEVVYSVVLSKARNPPAREDVESHFKGELSKK